MDYPGGHAYDEPPDQAYEQVLEPEPGHDPVVVAVPLLGMLLVFRNVLAVLVILAVVWAAKYLLGVLFLE